MIAPLTSWASFIVMVPGDNARGQQEAIFWACPVTAQTCAIDKQQWGMRAIIGVFDPITNKTGYLCSIHFYTFLSHLLLINLISFHALGGTQNHDLGNLSEIFETFCSSKSVRVSQLWNHEFSKDYLVITHDFLFIKKKGVSIACII